jgi:hypothetical protein
MPPLAPPNVQRLGRTAAQLLYDNPSWVHRRKESVQILDDTWFRRQLSIDYEIPDGVEAHRRSGGDQPLFAVPITLMRKSPPAYIDFDLYDQTKTAMSLMTLQQNAAVSLEALRWAAREAAVAADVLPRGANLPPNVDAILRRIAQRDPLTAGFAVRELRSPGQDPLLVALEASDRVMWLALALAEHSVLMAEVTQGDGRRRIIKLSYSERNINRSEQVADREKAREARSGLRPYPLFIDSPFIVAGTYHFELVAPNGLEIIDVKMREYGFLDALNSPHERAPFERAKQDPQQEQTAATVRRGTRTHLYAPDGSLTDRAEVDVLLRVQREGFVAAAAWVATTIAVLLTGFLALLKPVIEHQGVVPSILLIFVGLVATVVGGAEHHRLTIRMLNLARRGLLLSAACVFLATVSLALSQTGHGHSPRPLLWIVWAGLSALSIYCAVFLQLARRLPKQAPTRAEKRAGRLMRPLINLLDAQLLKSS